METGNPKQVAVLGVMAVAAIGFLLSRVGGKSLPVVAAAQTERQAGKSTGNFHNSPLLVDPFSHPKLAPPKAKTTQPVDSSSSPYVMAGTMAGPLPAVGEGSFEPAGDMPSKGKVPPKEKPNGPTLPDPVEMALEATAGASDNVAFISVAGADSQPFRPNDIVKGKIRLLRIDDGAVVLSGPKGELTIGVGERKRI